MKVSGYPKLLQPMQDIQTDWLASFQGPSRVLPAKLAFRLISFEKPEVYTHVTSTAHYYLVQFDGYWQLNPLL